jgi:hypothetical protein
MPKPAKPVGPKSQIECFRETARASAVARSCSQRQPHQRINRLGQQKPAVHYLGFALSLSGFGGGALATFLSAASNAASDSSAPSSLNIFNDAEAMSKRD